MIDYTFTVRFAATDEEDAKHFSTILIEAIADIHFHDKLGRYLVPEGPLEAEKTRRDVARQKARL